MPTKMKRIAIALQFYFALAFVVLGSPEQDEEDPSALLDIANLSILRSGSTSTSTTRQEKLEIYRSIGVLVKDKLPLSGEKSSNADLAMTAMLSPAGGTSSSNTHAHAQSTLSSLQEDSSVFRRIYNEQESTNNPTSLFQSKKPNLLMVITDEHNLRTISSYRNYFLTKHNKTQVDVWGVDVHLETPRIDSLADEGALYTNFKTAAPLCTPSRSSLLTGQYPQSTNTSMNNKALNSDIQTWADILRDERGYTTSYMGKFHLDGEEKPGWGATNGRDFGFDDNKYRYNRGHWKYFNESNGIVQEHTSWLFHETEFLQDHSEEETYATDFLVNRAMEYIENAVNVSNPKPFALVLSIADPHDPNFVRPHYRDMYKNLAFKYPESGRKKLKFDPAPPSFNSKVPQNVPIDEVDDYIENYENTKFVEYMQQYFGMCKCLDDNIGRLLDQLKDLGIDQDTVVVFTSDHGDMLGEHGQLDKGTPYETSAGVAFIVKYPRQVPKGKVIETAYSTIDFAPTILSLMGVPKLPPDVNFQGIDGSVELTSDQTVSLNSNQIVFSRSWHWVAAIKSAYKLIISDIHEAFLFDLNIDPEELVNFIDSPEHQAVKAELQAAVGEYLVTHEPHFVANNMDGIFLDKPTCCDSRNVLRLDESGEAFFCKDMIATDTTVNFCGNASINQHCSKACNTCTCVDSSGPIIVQGNVHECVDLSSACFASQKVRDFCPQTCGECSDVPSTMPSGPPSSMPTDVPSVGSSLPTTAPTNVPSTNSSILPTSAPTLVGGWSFIIVICIYNL